MSGHRKGLWMGGFAAVLLAGGIAWTFAQSGGGDASPGPKLLPANAVLYIGFDGGDRHKAAFEKTAAYDALYKSGLMDVFKKAVDRLQEQAGTAGVDQALSSTILKIVQHVIDHGASIAVAIEPNNQGPPIAFATVVLHDAAEFKMPIEQGIQLAMQGQVPLATATKHGREVTSGVIPDSPGVEVGWWVEAKKHLVFTVGINGVESALSVADGSAPNVTTNALFQKSSSAKGFEQNALAFIDFASLRKTFGGFPLPPTPTGKNFTVADVLKTLGLDTLNSVVSQSGFKGRACWTEITVDAPGPRSGLLSLMDQPSFTIKDLPALPPQLLNLVAVSIDSGKSFDTVFGVIRDIANMGDPRAVDQMNQGLAQAEAILGFRIREDLLAPLSGPMCLYVDATAGQGFDFTGLSKIGVALSTKDADKLRGTLQKLFDLINQQAGGEVVIEKSAKMGRDMHVIRIRQAGFITPTICVDKNWMHIALMSQAIDSALLRTDGKLPTWKPGEDHTAGLSELPQSFTSLSIGDTQTAYRQLLGAAPMLIGSIDTALRQNPNSSFEMPIKPEDLPPAELVVQSLFPNISVGTVNESGGKQYARTSLPGFDIGSTPAVVAIGTALLLPAVQQAREAARRTQAKNNLRQIALAMHNYHDVNGTFPAGTHPNEKLEVEERLSWMYLILPYIEQAALFDQVDAKQAWDSAANERIASTAIPIYKHPSAPNHGGGVTDFVGLAGVGEDGPKLPVNNPKAGIFAYDRATRLADITDGTSNTAAVAESDGQSRPWLQGGPSTIRPLTQQPYINGPDGIGGITRGGANVMFADGSVRFISENIDPSVFEALVTIQGGEAVGDF